MNRPYSEATVDLVAWATEQHHIVAGETDAMGNNPCVCGQWWDAAGDNPGWDQHMAEVALDALAAAGLLLPEGAETRTEWGVWWYGPIGDGIRLTQDNFSSRAAAEEHAPTRIGVYGITRYEIHRRIHRVFPDGSSWSGPFEPDAVGLTVGDSKPTQDHGGES